MKFISAQHSVKLLIFLILPLTSMTLFGQLPLEDGAGTTPAIEPAQASAEEFNILGILKKGGIMMYPLAVLSIGALVLILLYFLTIRRASVVSNRFMKTAEAMIRNNDTHNLISFCQRRNQSIARVTGKAVDFLSKNEKATSGEVREVAQSEGSRQAGILVQRITYLADIGSIAPMMGLLGTVIGMIKVFLDISEGNFEGVQQMKLGSGLSEALVTTASGLVIGIIALIFYSLFRARVQRYISELESATSYILALMNSQYQRSGNSRNASLSQTGEEDLPPPAHL